MAARGAGGAGLGALMGALMGTMLTALPAGAANTGYVSPTWVEARHAFTLALSGQTQICVSDFSRQQADLIGGELVLSVLQRRTIGYMCTNDSSWPYRIEFTVPGLDSGAYPVKVRWRSACEFDPTPCPAAAVLQDAGTLRVTDSSGLSYHIAPRVMPAGQASKLLLKGRFGCSDRISGMSVDTARPSIILNLTVQSPAIQCDTVVPGVEFALPPLDAGVWQVYAARSPYCEPGTVCPLAKLAPQLAGALEVKASSLPVRAPSPKARSLPLADGRAGNRASGFPAPGFRADWRGASRDAAGRREAGAQGPAATMDVKRDLRDGTEQNMPGGKP